MEGTESQWLGLLLTASYMIIFPRSSQNYECKEKTCLKSGNKFSQTVKGKKGGQKSKTWVDETEDIVADTRKTDSLLFLFKLCHRIVNTWRAILEVLLEACLSGPWRWWCHPALQTVPAARTPSLPRKREVALHVLANLRRVTGRGARTLSRSVPPVAKNHTVLDEIYGGFPFPPPPRWKCSAGNHLCSTAYQMHHGDVYVIRKNINPVRRLLPMFWTTISYWRISSLGKRQQLTSRLPWRPKLPGQTHQWETWVQKPAPEKPLEMGFWWKRGQRQPELGGCAGGASGLVAPEGWEDLGAELCAQQ